MHSDAEFAISTSLKGQILNETSTTAVNKKSPRAVLTRNADIPKLSQRLRETNTAELRSRTILAAMEAFKNGDFTVRLPTDWTQIDAQIAAAFNQTIAQKERISAEVARL